MAKIGIKSEKRTPFCGIFHVMEKFDRCIGSIVDGKLRLQCTIFSYKYSKIAGLLMIVNLYGGDGVKI